MANFPSVTAAGAFESTAVQVAIKTLAQQAVTARFEKLEYNSGVRKIGGLAAGLVSGSILFQVTSGMAQMILADAKFSASSPTPFVSGGALAEWAPTTPGIDVRGWALDASSGLTYRFDVARSGAVYLRGTPANATLQGVVMWPFTRPIPSNPIGEVG